MGSRVFIDLQKLMGEFRVEPKGIVHVGAHTGEEVGIYQEIGFYPIHLFEANPWLAAELALKHLDCVVHSCAIGPEKGEATLLIPERTQEASLREDFVNGEVKRVKVAVERLDQFLLEGCNVLVVDVQGGEMGVLQSTDLKQFDLIVCEVCIPKSGRPDTENNISLYLAERGFSRQQTFKHDHRNDTFDGVFLHYRCKPAQ